MAKPSPDRGFKDAVYEQFARIGKAASSPKRLELLDLLSQGERTVEVLAREAGVSVAAASHHLQALRAARLVESTKEGVYVTYRLADSAVAGFLGGLRGLAEKRLAELDQIVRGYFQGHRGMEPLDRRELARRVRRGETVLIDVRPPEEFRAAHIAGALSIPLKQLRARLAELPRDQEIVAYCRGPYCVLAVNAVEMLRRRGYRAARLEDGVREWQGRGLPVASAGKEV
ncbi:MAG: metalloregulator ArsR/SmtB family transcription factor [Candidatus Eisenbacteria bacterium]|nr:metalloregulator ArsR/SmtB family transcription factor [Candidatus Eisenbacteria bacterium]